MEREQIHVRPLAWAYHIWITIHAHHKKLEFAKKKKTNNKLHMLTLVALSIACKAHHKEYLDRRLGTIANISTVSD